MACLVYAMVVGLLALSVHLGFLGFRDWLVVTPAIVAFNVVVYVLLRSGWNQSLRDPSLTSAQMIAASLFMALTIYLLSDARGALLLLYLVLLIFGVLRLQPTHYMVVVTFSCACYAAAIGLAWLFRPQTVDPQVELLELAALMMLIPCGGFLAAYVGGLRRRLRERQVALQRAREAVNELTNKDDLTGVYNRRSILEKLEEERQRAARLGSALSVVMFDLDGFKRLNREFGHAAGDEVLRRMARTLHGGLRPVDELGRYGGEEFLVILPDTSFDEASRIGERLRRKATGCRPPELVTHFLLRVSAGVAEHVGGDDLWSLVARASAGADNALRAGGNRVAVARAGNDGPALSPASE